MIFFKSSILVTRYTPNLDLLFIKPTPKNSWILNKISKSLICKVIIKHGDKDQPVIEVLDLRMLTVKLDFSTLTVY